MPLGDDVLRLVEHPDDLALAANVRLRLNSLERLLALSDKINPQSGELLGVSAGRTILDSDGIKLYDGTPDEQDELATVKWYAGDGGSALGTVGAYRNTAKTTATMDIYANSDHKVNPGYTNGMLELAALGNGATNDWSTWLFLWAQGDTTTDEDVLEFSVGKSAAWVSPILVTHNFTTRESTITLLCSKATTGDPTGAEGMLYYNTFDNKIKMYADGAWRQLATW